MDMYLTGLPTDVSTGMAMPILTGLTTATAIDVLVEGSMYPSIEQYRIVMAPKTKPTCGFGRKKGIGSESEKEEERERERDGSEKAIHKRQSYVGRQIGIDLQTDSARENILVALTLFLRASETLAAAPRQAFLPSPCQPSRTSRQAGYDLRT